MEDLQELLKKDEDETRETIIDLSNIASQGEKCEGEALAEEPVQQVKRGKGMRNQ